MSFSRALLDSGQMVLPVFAVNTLVVTGRVELTDAPAIQEELTALQVTLFACQLVQTYQCHLYDSMTGCHADAVLVKDAEHIVGSLAGAVQQLILACCHIVGDAGFDKFAYIEGLMRKVPVHLPLLTLVPGVQGIVDGEVGLQVAVGFLS